MIQRFLLASLCLACGPASSADASRGPGLQTAAAHCAGGGELRTYVEDALRRLVVEHDYPGFAYAIAGPEGPIVEGGVGVSRRGSGSPMQADTLFQVGSITKIFTGALLSTLVASERIRLGDRLSDHWFAGDELAIDTEERPVTLQAIATHTAGLPRYPANLDREDGDPILGYPVESMRAALRDMPAAGDRDPDWDYSNFGYGVLAQAMARSQRQPFEALMASEVLEPVGLADTSFAPAPAQLARLATPYRDDDIEAETRPWEMGAMTAAGGLYSTVHDLAKFGTWLQSDDRTTIEARMLQRAPLVRQSATRAYGLGLFVVDDYVDRIDVLWHGGDVDGYAGSLVILPDHGMAIAYMTNIGFANGFADLQRGLISKAAELCGDMGGHP